MCGIAGWIGLYPTGVPAAIGRMQAALRKRGPDSTGLWVGNNVILAHTRLSIIDLEGSAQPMTTTDEYLVVTYNGEIYNFQELRSHLQAKGYTFRTQGDVEILLYLYQEDGDSMVKHLDGMFAFGLYDARNHRLLLARDRIGIKPLYYWHNTHTGELLFGSDMAAMLANPAVPRKISLQALAYYLHFGYVVHPESWLQDVKQVEPGQIVVWEDGELKKSRYYFWRYEPDNSLLNKAQAVNELRERLTASVHSHLVADVPLGSFLSGGLDSSTVTGLAQQVRARAGDAIDSFTVRFWLPEYDESIRARKVAKDLGTRHTEIDAQEIPFDRNVIISLLQGLGEPFGDTSFLAVYLLCQKARQFVKVALSGDGGDEIFYGYSGLVKQQRARRLRWVPAVIRRLIAEATRSSTVEIPRRINKYCQLSLLDDPGIIIDWHRRWPWPALMRIVGKDLFHTLFPAHSASFAAVHDLIGPGVSSTFLEQQLNYHMHVALPCDQLFKVDRMSMAHSLETRVPMLSNTMLDFGSHLPLHIRTDRKRSKEPLRTFAGSLSPTLAEPAGKHGFNFPLAQWLRGKAYRFWQEWEITSELARLGLQPRELDGFIERYGQSYRLNDQYNERAMVTQVFDLLLLGIWVHENQLYI